MHRRERWYHQLDNNRLVRPFDWGLSYIVDHVNGDDPRELFRKHTARVMQYSINVVIRAAGHISAPVYEATASALRPDDEAMCIWIDEADTFHRGVVVT